MCGDRPRPTQRQLRWQDFELNMFCHFGPKTFCNQEWGEGDDPPEVFAPSDLDPRQRAAAARTLTVAGGSEQALTAPFEGDAVLYLHREGGEVE